MAAPLSVIEIGRAFVDAFAAVWGARVGGEAAVASAEPDQSEGWTIVLPLAGAASGRLHLWFDREAAEATTRKLEGDSASADDVARCLMGLVVEAGRTLFARPEFAAVTSGAPSASPGTAAAGAEGFYLAVPNAASCRLAVAADVQRTSTATPDARLSAVLDVDLPLVVRFGRAVMPLRAIADLGPGSVIDMGRSPDEPVELLVGSKLVARGEVVVVSGNYGVRITELTADRDTAAELEARTS
jgi:flagellar motor switch protein FliN/FliY